MLMTAVLAATAALLLLVSLRDAAGSGAVFVQKTVCTRAVVCLRVTNATYKNAAT